MMQPTTTARPLRRLATEREVRARLLPIGKTTLYERARDGKIPGVVRVGQRVLFDLDVIEAWIDAGGDADSVRPQ